MRCKFCGEELSPGSRFCGSCGGEVPQPGQSSPDPVGPSDRQVSPPPTSGGTPQPPGGKKKGIVSKILASLLILALAAGVAGWFLFPSEIKGMFGNLRTTVAGSELGKASVKLPEQSDLIKTADWGVVPANQVIVVLKDGLAQKDADQVASALGGKVVGLFEYINLYQIEIGTKTEADLKKALALAKQQNGVELAFPNQQTFEDVKLIGTQVSALDDPVYQGEKCKGYEIVGVQRAWNLIKAAKVNLSDVNVGVVDSGLYKGYNEFDGGADVGGDTIANPQKEKDGTDKAYGSHGTGVTSIIAANPDNGGIAGIASGPLGKKLHVTQVDRNQAPYGNSWAPGPDPNDPTKTTYSNGFTQVQGDLVAVKAAIDRGAKTINCSWGNSNVHPEVAAGYKKFFEKMAKDHPDVIFVCSAGNDNNVQDGTRRIPSGLNLPNMITVGNIMNDGTDRAHSNKASANFEVTIAAPGQESIFGLDNNGKITTGFGGTSMATPHVTATVALMRSINPNLSTERIKRILKETASKGVTVGGPEKPEEWKTNLTPTNLGGGVLAVDQAVLAAINDLRKSQGLPELKMDDVLSSTRIDLVAESAPDSVKDWNITATLPGIVAADGTDAKIELQGGGAVGGSTTKHAGKSGDTLDWKVTTEKDTGTVLVTRVDTESKWKVDLSPDLAGLWSGTALIERVLESIPDSEKPKTESKECEGIDIVAMLKEMKGKNLGVKLNVEERKDPKEPWKAEVTFIGVDGKPGTPFPLILGYDNPDVYFEINEKGAKARFDGKLEGTQIKGAWNMTMPTEQGGTIEFMGGIWQVAKQN